MTKVEKLETEIQKLDPKEFTVLCQWFRKLDVAEWDSQIEEDVRTGKLDKLAEKAVVEHKLGKSKEL